MKLDFLKLSSDERHLYIEQAAIQRNISPVIMEKDFFVCWLLSILFESKFSESLVFKGGTSLSKIFGAINRFSEDIDLSLSPTFLGLPETAANRSQADKTEKKQGKFRKGHSGNPLGRPRGTRNKATIAAKALFEGEIEGICRKAIEEAKRGNIQGIKLVLDRILPPKKEAPILIE